MTSSCREIINLQVLQAGNQVGESFWQVLLAEHGLDESGAWNGKRDEEINRVGVFFTEVDGGSAPRYVPRSIQVDLEQGVIDKVRSGKIGKLFRPDTFVNAQSGAGNNWAKGYYTEGAELIEGILDVTRKQAEATECLQGFQLIHSLGGGSGAGLGTLMLSKLREEYPDRMLSTYSIMPSTAVSETVVEPYNAMLSLHQLLDSTDLTTCIDNEALYNISVNVLHNKQPQFADLNQIVSKVMCGTNTSLRFPGQLNGDLRKLAMNLIPFPRLHFLVPSYAPLVDPKNVNYNSLKTSDLTTMLFDKKNYLVACDPRFGRFLTAYTIFRGDIPSREAEIAVRELQQRNSDRFVEWIPDNVSISIVNVPPVGQKRSATGLSNTTAIQELFTRTLETFSAMYKRGAFLHWYTGEGMDTMEFSEAESNCQDLIAEYQQYQEATAYEEDLEEEYEEQGEEQQEEAYEEEQ
ncbi:beta-tubulin 2 [Cylindrobasidium torrendii FP15055 ss-10]|uniref:Beta-tubulin 2 n=1 Tax=Cylindrobasidium torrendii FP15055 ss-10 TaxID=1314674 RepID=A0A0D7B4X9_9AGAR|nr:beta-tubulin 2 [Cylindrobasidium torrendii FP15055 ss-10]